MKFHENPMGLFGWIGDDVTIYGGMQADGYHPKGHLWAHFIAFDARHRAESGTDRQIGKLKLLIKFHEEADPEVVQLLELEIERDLRRNTRTKQAGQGFGRRTVEALKDIINSDIEIKDIKPSAKGFWQKVGVDIVSRPRQIDGVLHPRRSPELEPITDNAAYQRM